MSRPRKFEYMMSFFDPSPKFSKADLVHLLRAGKINPTATEANILDYIIALNEDHIVFNDVQPSVHPESAYIAERIFINKANLEDARSKGIFDKLHADLVRLAKNKHFLGHYFIRLAYYYEGGEENLDRQMNSQRPAAAAAPPRPAPAPARPAAARHPAAAPARPAAAAYIPNDPLGFGMSMSHARNTIRRGPDYGPLGRTRANYSNSNEYEAEIAKTRTQAYNNYLKSMSRRGSRSRSPKPKNKTRGRGSRSRSPKNKTRGRGGY